MTTTWKVLQYYQLHDDDDYYCDDDDDNNLKLSQTTGFTSYAPRLGRPGIQLFRERLSEKVHATIPKGIVGGFKFTVLQRNLKEWQERPWEYVYEC